MSLLKTVKKTWSYQEKLAKPIGNSLFFNAWASVGEFIVMIFYNIIPAKTNQTGAVITCSMYNFMIIFFMMYIHNDQKLANYATSIGGIIFT